MMKKEQNLKCLMLLATLFIGVVFTMNAADQKKINKQILSISPMIKPAVVDGKINDGEWRGCAETQFFAGISGARNLDQRAGRVLVGYDEDNLYIAISSELPPNGKLVSTVRGRDGEVIHDDGIEIWLDPFLSKRMSGVDGLPYYQFIGNSIGTIFDQKFQPGKATDDAWNGKWKFANTINKKKKRWEAELSIAWKDLGVPAGEKMVGSKIGLLISRNWKQPSVQSVWMPCGAFNNPLTYPVVELTKNAPSVKLLTLGDIFNGKFAPEISIYNPSKENVECGIEIVGRHSDMPTKKYKKTAVIEPGKSKILSFKEKGDAFHPDAEHVLDMRVFVKNGGKELFNRRIQWKYPVSGKWKILGAASDGGLQFAYYPTRNLLRFKFDVESATTDPGVGECEFSLFKLISGKKGKKLASRKFAIESEISEWRMPVPALKNGTYAIECALIAAGKTVKTINKRFVRKHFPWVGNKLGLTKKVYPPFTPVKVSGNEVEVVLRKYTLNKLGLPKSVVIKGNDILADGGMKLRYATTDGKKGVLSAISGGFAETTAQKAVYKSVVKSKAVNLKIKSTIEYDGCVKVEMTLLPSRTELETLSLDIPVSARFATLWHICKAGLRSNPAGLLPKGSGVVWDSSKTGNGPILGTFLPYIWIGREVEGVAWFADNDKGWITDDAKPVQKIIRGNGKVLLRISFINKPATIAKSRRIVFGWQASPTKPMPANWRKPDTIIPMHGGSNRYWGIRPAYAGKYPAGRDYEFADKLLEARRTGKRDDEFLRKWYEKHYGDVKDKELEKIVKAHISAGMNWVVNAGKAAKDNPSGDVVMLYIEEHCQDQTTPEWITFQDEWGCKDFTAREWLKKLMRNSESNCGVKICPSKSYRDFFSWEAREWLKRGIGLYCDNCFLRQSFNTEMTAAYKRADGNIQLSSGIWDMREHHKRMWVLAQQMKPLTKYKLLLSNHMTNTQILPINTWDDVNLDIEWSWDGGNKPFPPDLLRAESLGRKTGSYPHALHQCTAKRWFMEGDGKNKYNPMAVRHDWGIQMVHEILRTIWGVDVPKYPLERIVRDFGYGERDCAVFNYWDEDYPVVVSDDKVKSIAMVRGGEALIVLTSWIDHPAKVQVELTGKLAKFAAGSAVNAEDGKAIAVKSGKVTLELPKYGVALLKFKK